MYENSLNIVKIGWIRGFFPEKFVNSFACKRNYFVLQSESATFAAGESEMWNASMRLNE